MNKLKKQAQNLIDSYLNNHISRWGFYQGIKALRRQQPFNN